MKEFKVIKLLDKIRFLYEKAGVDYDTLILILKAKLTMDGRRASTVFNNNKKKDDKDSNQFYKALWLYAFMGLFLGVILLIKVDIMYQMTIYFSAIMFLVLTVFISDFSYVILDIRDKNILATRGVDNKTLNAAKITHVCIYMILLTLALSGVSLLISFRYGIIYFLVFLMETLLINIFMIIVTALIYLLVLKFFDGEKLKDMINLVQVGLATFMAIGYQLIPRVFDIVDIKKVHYTPSIWHLLFPPMWFSSPLSMIGSENISTYKIIMTTLALIVPIISILIYIKLVPKFESYLQKLNNNYEKVKQKTKFIQLISKILCKDNIERSFFNFSVNIINSEREFKLKIYPNLGLAIVLPFLLMVMGFKHRNFTQAINYISHSKLYFTIYFFAYMIPIMMLMLRYSENYKGAWIYQVAPINATSSIFKGIVKGTFYKLIMPPYIIISILFILLFSTNVIKHLIVIFLVVIFLTLINFKINPKVYPFSSKFDATNNSDAMVSAILSLFIISFLAGFHFLTTFFSVGIYIYGAILLIIDILMWKYSFNIPKSKLA